MTAEAATWVDKNNESTAHKASELLEVKKDELFTILRYAGLDAIDKNRIAKAELKMQIASGVYDGGWKNDAINHATFTNDTWTDDTTYAQYKDFTLSSWTGEHWVATNGDTKTDQAQPHNEFIEENIDVTAVVKAAESDKLSIALTTKNGRRQVIQNAPTLEITMGKIITFNVTDETTETGIDDAVIEIKTKDNPTTVATLTTADGGSANVALVPGEYTYTVTSAAHKIKKDGTLTVAEDAEEAVTLTPNKAASLTLDPAAPEAIGKSGAQVFTATVKDQDDRDMSGATLEWTVQKDGVENDDVTIEPGLGYTATVKVAETPTHNPDGKYTVKAKVTGVDPEVAGTATITVNTKEAATITVNYKTSDSTVRDTKTVDGNHFVDDMFTLPASYLVAVRKPSTDTVTVYKYKSGGTDEVKLTANTTIDITVEDGVEYSFWEDVEGEAAQAPMKEGGGRDKEEILPTVAGKTNATAVWHIAGDGGYGRAGIKLIDPTKTTGKKLTMKFDVSVGVTARLSVSDISSSIGGDAESNNTGTPGSKAFTLQCTGSSDDHKLYLVAGNGSSADAAPVEVTSGSDFVHVEATMDITKHTSAIKIYTYKADGNYSGESALYEQSDVPFRDSTVNQLGGFKFTGNSGSNVYLDNIEVLPPTD